MIVIDVETQWTPDLDAIDASVPPVPPADELSPPANYKDAAKIEDWRAKEHARLLDKRAEEVKEAYRSTALDALQGAVLCVGIAVDDREPVCVWEATEEATLTKLQAGISKYPQHAVYGWNSLTFDWPFLTRRAMRHKLWDLAGRLYYAKPYGNRQYVDLFNVWQAADRRSKGKLYDVARHLGIEVKETISGAYVPELWHQAQGTMAEGVARQQIVDHVLEDVRATREIARVFERAGWIQSAA